ncbi:hypothetical protein NSA50_16770 [Clostridium sp. DSM 100503]|uniref:hypothetical protein n=1 Tax=Clostridium sp. DSM 100503 TaxID=2963282 RepID=UPI00214A17DE|nr:hypothetical protein [Clostridium sp. DSM 100503]MCR1952680.1 hypothetical protein [Clostridium sp. DSM 100503]
MENLLIMMLLFGLGTLICGIVSYVFMALSLSSAAGIEGVDRKWFAWIPLLNILILLKLVNKSSKYIWVFIATSIVGFIANYNGSIFLIIINIALSIWSIIIQIQAYSNIANKYKMNSAWFIVGIFVFPVMMVAFIILYNKVKVIEKH